MTQQGSGGGGHVRDTAGIRRGGGHGHDPAGLRRGGGHGAGRHRSSQREYNLEAFLANIHVWSVPLPGLTVNVAVVKAPRGQVKVVRPI